MNGLPDHEDVFPPCSKAFESFIDIGTCSFDYECSESPQDGFNLEIREQVSQCGVLSLVHGWRDMGSRHTSLEDHTPGSDIV